jgi:hypothetical protein
VIQQLRIGLSIGFLGSRISKNKKLLRVSDVGWTYMTDLTWNCSQPFPDGDCSVACSVGAM